MATLYAVIYASALADPTVAQVKAGQQNGGSAATWSGSTTAPTGSGTFDWPSLATGLTAATSYKVAFVWSDGTNDSTVAVSAAFKSATAGDIAETPSATDSLSGAVTAPRSIAETPTATDSLSGAAALPGSISETPTATDSLSATRVGAGSITETPSATDSLSSAAVFVGAISETPTLTDAIDGTLNGSTFTGSISETPTLTDSLSGTRVGDGTLAESPALTDSLTAAGSQSVTIGESLSLVDDLSAAGGASTISAVGSYGKDGGPRLAVRVNGKLHIGTRAQVMRLIDEMAQADARASAAQPQAPTREQSIKRQAQRVATKAIESVKVQAEPTATTASAPAPALVAAAPSRDELVAQYVRAYALQMIEAQRQAKAAADRAIADAMRREAEIEADDMDAINRVLQLL